MNWLSIHIYPTETQNVLLVRTLKPFLEKYVWPQKQARAFFIRYQDEQGPHIRLRIRGEAEWLSNEIQPVLAELLSDQGTWTEVPYVPEPERFGGEKALAWAEDYFHVSTRVVLDRLAREERAYGDAMFDALRMHVIAVYSVGFAREKARWYFSRLFDLWLPLFFGTDIDAEKASITASFEETIIQQKEQLRATMDSLWNSLLKEKFDEKQPEWLRWLRGNQLILNGLEGDLEKAMPSLLHLTNNRLGINNQDEVYLHYILSKVL